MVQFIRTGEQQPNYLREISEKFGQGLSQGLSDQLKSYYDNKQRIEKGRPQARTMLRQTFKQYGADKGYDENFRQRAEQYADQLVQQGYDPLEASDMAYQQMVSGFPDEKGKPTMMRKERQTKTQAALENVKGGFAKGLRPLVQVGQIPVEAGHAFSNLLERTGSKIRDFIGLDKDKAPFDVFANLPKPKVPFEKESPLQAYDRLTGGRGIPQNVVERIAAGYPLGPSGLVGGAAEEAAKGLGVPEELAPLANIAGLAGAEKAALNPKLLNSLMGLAEKFPWFKSTEVAPKPAAKSETAAPKGSKLDEMVGSAATKEDVVKEAASNLAGRGVDLTKVAEGDPQAVNEFNKELRKTSEYFQKAEQFHAKDALKRRAETAEKLKESPLEKYYAPKPEKGVKAQAAKELRTAPLKERVAQLEPEVKHAYRQFLSSENALRNARGTASEDVLARLQANVEMNRLNHSRMLNELRNTEFAIRNRKPPATTEEIGKQIEKSFAELREGIKNPTAEKLQEVRKKLQDDKELIEMAQKLVKRGEIPGPEVFDEYIKIHQQYNKAYGDLQKELSEFIKDNQNVAMKQQVENAKKLRDLVKDMQKAGEAKVVNQIDKRKALRALDKPSGAFLRNMLKDLKREIDAFQKQFFNVKNVTHPGEAKVSAKAKESIRKDIPKTAAETVKNPTGKNAENLSEKTDIPKEEAKTFGEKINEEAKAGAKKVEEGKATENDIKKLWHATMKAYSKLPPLKRALTGGVIMGALQALAEEYLGYRPSVTQIGLVAGSAGLPGGSKAVRVGAGAGTIAPFVYKYITYLFESAEARNLKDRQNTPEFNEYRKELEERYGKTKANRIMKRYQERT